MAYNKDLDKALWEKSIDGEDGKQLMVSVHSYNGGDAKLQIGPRVYTKKDGNPGYGKAGRLTIEEGVALANLMGEALEVMDAPGKQ